ncbi:MAG: ribonuclease III [Verrucomicrobiota bacterium]
MPNDLASFEAFLGYSFNDRSLLERALTHPSCLAEGSKIHNQRLEFLGDSVLGLILAEELFKVFPDEREGHLARARSALASGDCLADLARKLQLQDFLHLGQQEEKTGGRERDAALEDALEAVVAAIYLDSDFKTTRSVVLGWYGDVMTATDKLLSEDNPKGRLQELVQGLKPDSRVSYELVDTSGPDHRKAFIMEVRIDHKPCGLGQGFSKKDAEEAAAREALLKLEASKPV